MCRLIGFSGYKGQTFNPWKIKLMFMYSEDQGKDSSGFYSPTQDIVKKMYRTSRNLVPEVEILPDRLFIGHTRNQSKGSIDIDNAHPFKKEGIVLAHNGTISNIDDLLKEEELDYEFSKNDSRYLLDMFVKYKKPKLILPKLEGVANLLIHYEKKPNILYVYKHPERTLMCGETEEGIYISSERDALRAIDCKEIVSFNDHHFYTLENGLFHKNPLKIEMKKKPVYSMSTMMGYGGGDSDWGTGDDYYENDNPPKSSQIHYSVKDKSSSFNILKYNAGRLLKHIGETTEYRRKGTTSNQKVELKKDEIVTSSTGLVNNDGQFVNVFKEYSFGSNTYHSETEMINKEKFLPNPLVEIGDIVKVVHKHDVDAFIGKTRDAGYNQLIKDELLLVVEIYSNTQEKNKEITNRRDIKLDGYLAVRLTDIKKWNDQELDYPTFYYSSEEHCWVLDKIERALAREVAKLNLSNIEAFLSVSTDDVLKIEEKHKWVNEEKEESEKNKKSVDETYVKLKKGVMVQHYKTKVLFEVDEDYTQKQFSDDIHVTCWDAIRLETHFIRFTELIVYKPNNHMVVEKGKIEPTEEELAETSNNVRDLSTQEKDQVCGDLDSMIEKVHELYRLSDKVPGSFTGDVGAFKTQLVKAIDALKEEFIKFNHDIVDQSVSIEDYTDYFNITLTTLDHEFNTHD
jgi:predicted glutamine amidotransferase